MKIEKITDNIFRVTITLTDLEQRKIDINAIDVNSPKTIALFNDLMEQVASQFGFDFTGTQLVIDPVPNLDNSFDVTITKVEEDIDFESIHKYIKNKYRKSEIGSKKRSGNVYSSVLAYAFRSFDDVSALARDISAMYRGESALFRQDSQYFLFLAKSHVRMHDEQSLDCRLSEYGTRVSNPAIFEGYLREHGSIIIKDKAVERLSEFYASP